MSVSRFVPMCMLLAGLVALWGCGRSGNSSSTSFDTPNFKAKAEPWRLKEEKRCLALGVVRPSPFLIERAALGGPSSYCGAEKPFEMSAALDGRVAMRPAALLRCEMIPAVDKWVRDVVEPVARRNYGLAVVELKVAASYGCRPMNNIRGATLSEHGHANAIDISGFRLTDGRWITVKGGWYGNQRDAAFLRQVHSASCAIFMTVLGPNFNPQHRDHFHLDLAWHGRDGQQHICR